VTDHIRRAGQVAWAVVGILVLVYLLARVAFFFSILFPTLIFAGAIVFLLNPVVTKLNTRGIRRGAATGVAYLLVLGVLVGAAALLVPVASGQADELREDWPEIQAKAERWIDARADESQGTFWEFTREGISDSLSTGDKPLSDRIEQARKIGVRVFEILLIVFLSPVIAFYLLVDLPRVQRSMMGLVPAGARVEVELIAGRLNRAIGGYFRGQLFVALLVGLMSSFGLAVIGLRFWFLVGMIAGLFNIIPLIGPWVGGVPGVIIALTTGSPLQALGVVIVMVTAQQIDNHFITPQVMHRAVHLHPAVVVLALLAGGHISGFFGLLIAVPLTATLKIVLGHLWRHHVLGEELPDPDNGQPDDGEGVVVAEGAG
jgi:predicted PurR-regulated permease PerM